jgi:hypothetical protein
MIFDKGSVIFSDNSSFEAVLDRTCERLWGKKVQYSIRRLRELEADLQNIEQELNAFLCKQPNTNLIQE